jgi:hypothetical protein
MTRSISLLFLVAFFGLLASCETTPFSQQDELTQNDSLFLGMYLGMPQKDFFDHCTELNKQQIIVQGPGGNTSVEYRMTDLEGDVSMRFFPTFIDEKIFEMPVTYSYAAWAPWNKQYWSDVLLEQMVDLYKKWYGEDFKLLNHPTQGKVYYKIDGKRRINLFVMDEQFVQAVFTDLKVEKRLKEEFKNSQSPNDDSKKGEE